MPIYMQYLGIAGNVQNAVGLPGPGWIELTSFQWGVGRSLTHSTGSDKEASAPSVSEIVVTKKADASSPILFNACVGRQKREVSIIFTNAVPGRPPGPRNTLNLSRAVIMDITPCGPQRFGRGELTRYEKLTITFPEHHFNGIRNSPIPHGLVRPEGI